MNKLFATTVSFLLACNIAFSQIDSLVIDSFLISISKNIPVSKFKQIAFTDNRGTDTSALGIIIEGKGMRNLKMQIVQPQTSFESQFGHIVDSVTHFSDTGKLVIQIDKIRFEELRTSDYLGRFFLFRANLYANYKQGYCLLDAIDTFVTVKIKNQKDLIKEYHASANETIVKFILRNLNRQLLDTTERLSFYEIQKIDSLNKSKIKFYVADSLIEGVYTTYESFKEQIPNYTDFETTFKEGILKKVEKPSYQANDDMDYSFPKKYAVVTGNKAYIFIDGDYHQLEKRKDDFFFKRVIKFVTDASLPKAANWASTASSLNN